MSESSRESSLDICAENYTKRFSSITVEDTFNICDYTRPAHLHDHYKLYYKCPVLPITINSHAIDSYSLKTEYLNYLKNNKFSQIPRLYGQIGTQCAICCDPILHKKNAQLTMCGHMFHKICYNSYINSTFVDNCPLCRTRDYSHDFWGMGLERYISSVVPGFNDSPNLDYLANFEFCSHLVCPDMCDDHHLGMNKECMNCIHWRKTGLRTDNDVY